MYSVRDIPMLSIVSHRTTRFNVSRFVRSSPAVVLRSQSYHSGVGQSAADHDDEEDGDGGCDHDEDEDDGGAGVRKRWTLISTESSDEDDGPPRY